MDVGVPQGCGVTSMLSPFPEVCSRVGTGPQSRSLVPRAGAWSPEQELLKEERSLFVDQSPASLGSGRNTLYKLPREMAPLGTQVAVLGDEPPGVWALVMLDKGAVSA